MSLEINQGVWFRPILLKLPLTKNQIFKNYNVLWINIFIKHKKDNYQENKMRKIIKIYKIKTLFSMIQSNKQKIFRQIVSSFLDTYFSFLYFPCHWLVTGLWTSTGLQATLSSTDLDIVLPPSSPPQTAVQHIWCSDASAEMKVGELLVVMLSQTLKEEVRFCTALFMRTSILINRLILHLGEHFLDGDFLSILLLCRKENDTMRTCEIEEVRWGGVWGGKNLQTGGKICVWRFAGGSSWMCH